jgi:hypothetical protein
MSHSHPGATQSADVSGQLAEACDAFDDMVAILGGHASSAGHLVTPFVMALAAAADGRDTMLGAPSLAAAAAQPRPPRPDLAGQPPEAIADALAERARLLSARLAVAAQAAPDARDRAALAGGSQHAAAVHDCLAGTGLWPPPP